MSLLTFSCNVVAVVVVQVIVFMLARRGTAIPGDGCDLITIQSSRATCNWLFVLFMLPPILVEAAGIFLGPGGGNFGREYLLIVLAVLFASCFFCVWETHRSALVVCHEGIERRSAWLGRDFMAWDEVKRLAFSNGDFLIRGKGWRGFKVTASRAGVDTFLDLCERHLSPAAMWCARAGYAAIRRDFPYARVSREA